MRHRTAPGAQRLLLGLVAAALVAASGPGASTPAVAADATYAGSASCAPCHPTQSEAWRDAPHARTLRVPDAADLERLEESLLCAQDEADLVVGIRRHLRFASPPDAEGRRHLLPCRWNRVTGAWETVGDLSGPRPVWGEVCANCHETGRGATDEWGIGCEACHGPAAAHAANPVEVHTFAFPEDAPGRAASVCGACHLQGGSSPGGKPFPEGFVPGEDLAPHFSYPWARLDGDEGDRHSELDLRAVLVEGASTRPCLACHDPHDQSATRHAQLERVALCDQCHVPGGVELRPDRETECPVCQL